MARIAAPTPISVSAVLFSTTAYAFKTIAASTIRERSSKRVRCFPGQASPGMVKHAIFRRILLQRSRASLTDCGVHIRTNAYVPVPLDCDVVRRLHTL